MLGRYDESLEEERKFGEGLPTTARNERPSIVTFLDACLLQAYLLSRAGRYREAHARIAEGTRTAGGTGSPGSARRSFPCIDRTSPRRTRRPYRPHWTDWTQVRRQQPQLSVGNRPARAVRWGAEAFEGMARARAGQLAQARELLMAPTNRNRDRVQIKPGLFLHSKGRSRSRPETWRRPRPHSLPRSRRARPRSTVKRWRAASS